MTTAITNETTLKSWASDSNGIGLISDSFTITSNTGFPIALSDGKILNGNGKQ